MVIPNGRHSSPAADPLAFNDALLGFLKTPGAWRRWDDALARVPLRVGDSPRVHSGWVVSQPRRYLLEWLDDEPLA
jgi:hypothetical protein